MLEDGSLANIQLKGSAVQSWGEFTQKTRSRLADEWVTVKSAKEGKKGAVKFHVPVFEFDHSLSEAEANLADDAFDVIEAYFKTYLAKAEPVIEPAIEDEDDLEF